MTPPRSACSPHPSRRRGAAGDRQASWSLAKVGRVRLLRGELAAAAFTLDAALALVRAEGWVAFQPCHRGRLHARAEDPDAERLTDAMVSVEGEHMRGVTWCVIDEVASGDRAIGGRPLTTEAVRELAAGQPA